MARTFVSVTLVLYLLFQVNPQHLLELRHHVGLTLLALAVLLQLGGVCLSSWKWWLLLRASERPVPYLWAVQTYLIGQFFSNFLPTMIGGDAIRVYRLNRRIQHPATAFTSVLVERLTGFLALIIIAVIALVLSFRTLLAAPTLLWATIWCLLIAAGGLVFAWSAPFIARGMLQLPVPNVIDWRGKLQMVAQTLGHYYTHPRTLAFVTMLSFIYQLSWIGVNYIVIRALDLHVPFSFTALVVPISDIIGLVPIFLNSLGARGGTFLILLRQTGVSADGTVALALLVFVIRMVVSLLGGMLYLLQRVPHTSSTLTQDLRAAQQSPQSEEV